MPKFQEIKKVRPDNENTTSLVNDLKVELYSIASKKLQIDTLEGKLKKDKSALIDTIFAKCSENSLFSKVPSGDLVHEEVILEGPPGNFSIKIQLQSSSENVEVSSAAIDWLRKKLKEKAEAYIVKQELIPYRAIESLVLQKLITLDEADGLLIKTEGAKKRIIKKA
jgi:hypothetical protein